MLWESVSFYPDYSNDTVNDTNTDDVAEEPIDLITASPSTYPLQNTDSFNGTDDENQVDKPMKSGRVIVEYKDMSALQNTTKTIDIKKFYQGCGHIVYNGSFYFHNAGTKKLIKFDLETRRTNTLIIENTRYRNLNYLFSNSKTYFKFAVDENGLWVIFASTSDDTVMVAKLNHTAFSVVSVINTAYPITKAGNGFIACGVLYITDDQDKGVTYAFDLKKENSLDASFDLRPENGILAMLSYYPNKQLLYMWDNSSVKICKVIFSVD
ncbi:gliomedin-like [Diretmus argenteus]